MVRLFPIAKITGNGDIDSVGNLKESFERRKKVEVLTGSRFSKSIHQISMKSTIFFNTVH